MNRQPSKNLARDSKGDRVTSKTNTPGPSTSQIGPKVVKKNSDPLRRVNTSLQTIFTRKTQPEQSFSRKPASNDAENDDGPGIIEPEYFIEELRHHLNGIERFPSRAINLDLPHDMPSMEHGLSVPDNIRFSRNSKGGYFAKFAISNTSNMFMTYRVMSTDYCSIFIKPDIGIISPKGSVSVLVRTPIFGNERLAVYGFPIYSSSQLGKRAIETLWSAFRTPVFPEREAEEHSIRMILSEWSIWDDLNVFKNVQLFFQDEKKIDWGIYNEIPLDLEKFNHFWRTNDLLMCNLREEGEKFGLKRKLERDQIDNGTAKGVNLAKTFGRLVIVIIGCYLYVNFRYREVFQMDDETPIGFPPHLPLSQ